MGLACSHAGLARTDLSLEWVSKILSLRLVSRNSGDLPFTVWSSALASTFDCGEAKQPEMPCRKKDLGLYCETDSA